jgi:ATP-dependent protease HslVU (ClpYQ) ATPase subunit
MEALDFDSCEIMGSILRTRGQTPKKIKKYRCQILKSFMIKKYPDWFQSSGGRTSQTTCGRNGLFIDEIDKIATAETHSERIIRSGCKRPLPIVKAASANKSV